MAKLKITIHEQIEIDLEFPIYVKVNDNTFCFFEKENNGIKIDSYPFSYGIEVSSHFPNQWMLEENITKEEFEAEFKKVQEKINQLL